MDVIVIGAGLAGLTAAQRLTAAGKTVTLLEARARVGGRVWTKWDSGLDHPIDLGAEWIGDGAAYDLLKKHHTTLKSADGKHLRRHAGQWQDMTAWGLLIDQLMKRLEELGAEDRPLIQGLEECCSDPILAEARELLLSYVQGFDAADPSRVSTRWLQAVEKNQPAGAAQYRSMEGAGRIADLLLQQLPEGSGVTLETVVRNVRWKRGHVSVTAERGGREEIFEAPKALVTLPLPQLQAGGLETGAVRFSPELRDRRGALSRVEMGQAHRIVLRFRELFWETNPVLCDLLFLHDFSQPFPTWWSESPARVPLLNGWTAGPQSNRLKDARDDEVVDLALTSLASAMAMPRKKIEDQLVSWHYHNWSKDPFSRGAYSYVLAGGIDAHKELARPLEDTLFFAGEATCGEGYNATMEGAMRSGQRAAKEILA